MLKIFSTLCFLRLSVFFSINVTFWLYCHPFSVKKDLESFQKILFFILSLVQIQFLRKFFFAFLISFRTRFCCFLYAFRSSSKIHNHWILFRRSNQLSYQAMSSTCTQSQLCITTTISSISSLSDFISAFAFVSSHVYFNRKSVEVIIWV